MPGNVVGFFSPLRFVQSRNGSRDTGAKRGLLIVAWKVMGETELRAFVWRRNAVPVRNHKILQGVFIAKLGSGVVNLSFTGALSTVRR